MIESPAETEMLPSSNPPLPARWVLTLAVAAAAFACFLPALGNGFVNWDDNVNFLDNPDYRGFSASNLKWMFTDTALGHYIPLTWMTLALDYELWGLNPKGYHLTSAIFHAVNALLFCLVLLKLLERAGAGGMWAAAGGALFFALHPLRVESVAWATERRDVVSGLFFLLSVLAYLRMQEAGARRRWYAVSILAFAASLLSKTMGMGLPVALLALDVWPLRRFSRAALVEKIPYIVLMLAAMAVTAATQMKVGAMVGGGDYALVDRIFQPGCRLLFYIGKTLVPLGLSPLYPFHPVHGAVPAAYILCGLGAAAITVALVLLRRRWPAGLAAWVIYAALLGPVIGVFQAGSHFAADRYTYLACLPWAALAAGALAGSRRIPAAIAAAAVLLTLGALTVRQTAVWRDSMSLWEHAIEIDPDSCMAFSNRAAARMELGDAAGALADNDVALRLNPSFAEAYGDRGIARAALKDFDGAIADYTRAVTLKPDYAKGYDNRGVARAARGDVDGAMADYTRAIEINPFSVKAYSNRSGIWISKQKYDNAVADSEAAIRINPYFAEAYGNRGIARMGLKDFDGAAADYAQALRLAPPGWPHRKTVEDLLKQIPRKR